MDIVLNSMCIVLNYQSQKSKSALLSYVLYIHTYRELELRYSQTPIFLFRVSFYKKK